MIDPKKLKKLVTSPEALPPARKAKATAAAVGATPKASKPKGLGRAFVTSGDDNIGLVATVGSTGDLGSAVSALRSGGIPIASASGGELHLAVDKAKVGQVKALLKGAGFKV
jgi:hypothetical protein